MDDTSVTIIKQKLLSLGASEQDLDTMIDDVNGVIISEALYKHIQEKVDPATFEKIKSFTKDELFQFVSDHAAELGQVPSSLITSIGDRVWNEYFEYMAQ